MAEAVLKRCTSSDGLKASAMHATQTPDHLGAIYNGRPLELTPPPISIYHPVFSHFTQTFSETPDRTRLGPYQLLNAYNFCVASVAYYKDREQRRLALQNIVTELLGGRRRALQSADHGVNENHLLWVDGSVVSTGCKYSLCPLIMLLARVGNEIGDDSSDPSAQLACDYVAICSSRQVTALNLFVTTRRVENSP